MDPVSVSCTFLFGYRLYWELSYGESRYAWTPVLAEEARFDEHYANRVSMKKLSEVNRTGGPSFAKAKCGVTI